MSIDKLVKDIQRLSIKEQLELRKQLGWVEYIQIKETGDELKKLTLGEVFKGKFPFTAEVIYEGAISLRAEYDRAAFYGLIQAAYTIFLFHALTGQIELPIPLREDWVIDKQETFHRIISKASYLWQEGPDAILTAAKEIREELSKNNKLAPLFERIEKVTALDAEIIFSESLVHSLDRVIGQLLQEVTMIVDSGGFHIPAESFNALVRNRTFLVRPRGSGGDTRSKHKWTEEESQELESNYRRLLQRIKEAKRWYNRNKKDEDWPKLIRIKYPDFSDSLIRRLCHPHRNSYRWTPSDIAIEYATRLCNLHGYTYCPFSLTPRQLREKLPEKEGKTVI